MRTYKILEDKVRLFNKDKDIQKILKQIHRDRPKVESLVNDYTPEHAEKLLGHSFDRAELSSRPLPYEKLDQMVFELLMGVR